MPEAAICKLQKTEGVRDSKYGAELPWIDWEAGVIRVRAFHTKTMTARLVPLSKRAKQELRAWIAQTPEEHTSVFGEDVEWSIRYAFKVRGTMRA